MAGPSVVELRSQFHYFICALLLQTIHNIFPSLSLSFCLCLNAVVLNYKFNKVAIEPKHKVEVKSISAGTLLRIIYPQVEVLFFLVG